tara:strand:+ start:472 stop:654 length:183 start_codon:yes stop_codon:yes gene_type:complete
MATRQIKAGVYYKGKSLNGHHQWDVVIYADGEDKPPVRHRIYDSVLEAAKERGVLEYKEK